MDAPEGEPALDVVEGDVEVLGTSGEMPGDAEPSRGAVFPAEMVVVRHGLSTLAHHPPTTSRSIATSGGQRKRAGIVSVPMPRVTKSEAPSRR